MKTPNKPAINCEVFILAGGLSTRMGRDKSRVRIGKRTLLQHVRATASQLGYPVRTVRRDAIARSGPIGGIYTALKRSRAEAVIFLACDMPFVEKEWLKALTEMYCNTPFKMLKENGLGVDEKVVQGADLEGFKAVFTVENGLAGFPCIIGGGGALQTIAGQISRGQFSLQSLATTLGAKLARPPKNLRRGLMNINTPQDLAKAGGSERIGRKGPIEPI